mmetsp:Transcript_12268/g.23776  ORF Transcript_12268/g.23776 Transcript_12268/m.23776 type:complete len:82 (-) Transcript_12268:397-642(-)
MVVWPKFEPMGWGGDLQISGDGRVRGWQEAPGGRGRGREAGAPGTQGAASSGKRRLAFEGMDSADFCGATDTKAPGPGPLR